MQLKGARKGMDCSLVVGDMGLGFWPDNSPDSCGGKSFINDIPLQHKFIAGNHDDRALSYLSANEINFIAFGLAAEEYHNELYGELCGCNNGYGNIKQFDIDFFQVQKGESANSPWKGNQNEVSIHTFLRNQIHHQADNGKPDYEKLRVAMI